MSLSYKRFATNFSKTRYSAIISNLREKNFYSLKKLFLLLFSLALLFIVVVPIFTYVFFIRDLASRETIMNRNNTGVLLLDRHGKPFYSFYEAKQREFIPLKEVALDFQKAVVSVEDKTFYDHSGFSFRAIIGAFWADIQRREWRYGGSTLTQQLVKNSLLTSDKSFLRKYQELVLAMEIERRFSKDEILEMYVNSIYFGEGAYGIGNAAEVYFNKLPKDLNLAESAVLAGLPVAPSALSPLSGNREKALERERFVLEEMVEEAAISSEQKELALNTKLVFQEKKEQTFNQAPHFALMVQKELIDKFGEEKISRSGFKVYTSLDLEWQKEAEEQLSRQVKNLASNQVTNGSVVVEDNKTGEIRALVGSYSWLDPQFGKVNMAITPRQPGSAFKPFVYSDGFERRIITPASVLKDFPKAYPMGNGEEYKPTNYDGTFRGEVLVRRALANSLNIPAVEVMEKVGVASALQMAKRLGITTLNEEGNYGLSLVLGSGEVPLMEMTNAYATFATGGKKPTPTLFTKIEDKKEKVVFQSVVAENQVLESKVAFLISDILSDDIARQEEFGGSLTTSRLMAVKTGTTTDYKDSWTLGYTPSLTIGVWVGNNDNKPMSKIAGSLGAAPIWKNLMEKYLQGTPVEKFIPPADLNHLTICRFNGLLLRDNIATSAAFKEYFIKGTEPSKNCIITTPTPTPEQEENDENQDNKQSLRSEELKENNEPRNGSNSESKKNDQLPVIEGVQGVNDSGKEEKDD